MTVRKKKPVVLGQAAVALLAAPQHASAGESAWPETATMDDLSIAGAYRDFRPLTAGALHHPMAASGVAAAKKAAAVHAYREAVS